MFLGDAVLLAYNNDMFSLFAAKQTSLSRDFLSQPKSPIFSKAPFVLPLEFHHTLATNSVDNTSLGLGCGLHTL